MSSAVKSPSFIFEGAPLAFAPGQSVLEALEGAGAQVESSCRAGVCQSCLLACVTGDIPAAAQAGLTPAQKRQGLFTSCQCPADEALVIMRPGVARGRAEAEVVDLDWLTDSVVRLRLKPLTPFPFAPGQFLNLGRDGVTRSYSIASTPDQGDLIELHVRILPGGRMSALVAHGTRIGDRFTLTGPSGACTYSDVDQDAALILAGAGTGLAPLWAVLHGALHAGHRGPIVLLHGAATPDGLYLAEELQALNQWRDNVRYLPCVRSDLDGRGDLLKAMLACGAPLKDADIFLCGDAGLVNGLKKTAFLNGAKLGRIRADSFVAAHDEPVLVPA
jgi:CDP-4-dehydro-6-deoxyglucose reductase